MKPDIGSESRFLPTPNAFDAPLRQSPSEFVITFDKEKLEWCCYPMVKKLGRYVYPFWQNVRTWQTDTHTDTVWRHRPHLHSIARSAINKFTCTPNRTSVMYKPLASLWFDCCPAVIPPVSGRTSAPRRELNSDYNCFCSRSPRADCTETACT